MYGETCLAIAGPDEGSIYEFMSSFVEDLDIKNFYHPSRDSYGLSKVLLYWENLKVEKTKEIQYAIDTAFDWFEFSVKTDYEPLDMRP